MTSYYLNTDLDLISENSFGELMAVFGESVAVLHYGQADDGTWCARIESTKSGEGLLEDDIEVLLSALRDLPNDIISELRSMEKFDFNVGWQSSQLRPEGFLSLSNTLLKSIADIGATCTVTIYPSSEKEEEE